VIFKTELIVIVIIIIFFLNTRNINNNKILELLCTSGCCRGSEREHCSLCVADCGGSGACGGC